MNPFRRALTLAAFSLALPLATAAAQAQDRLPTIPPKDYSPEQKQAAEAFAQAIGIKVTNVDGEGGAVKVALTMLASDSQAKRKGTSRGKSKRAV